MDDETSEARLRREYQDAAARFRRARLSGVWADRWVPAAQAAQAARTLAQLWAKRADGWDNAVINQAPDDDDDTEE